MYQAQKAPRTLLLYTNSLPRKDPWALPAQEFNRTHCRSCRPTNSWSTEWIRIILNLSHNTVQLSQPLFNRPICPWLSKANSPQASLGSFGDGWSEVFFTTFITKTTQKLSVINHSHWGAPKEQLSVFILPNMLPMHWRVWMRTWRSIRNSLCIHTSLGVEMCSNP